MKFSTYRNYRYAFPKGQAANQVYLEVLKIREKRKFEDPLIHSSRPFDHRRDLSQRRHWRSSPRQCFEPVEMTDRDESKMCVCFRDERWRSKSML